MAPPQGELYFHQAQAAPAALPEFKGNVVAVETAPFWDADLDTLHRRDVKFWSQQDARAAEAAKDQVLLENGFTPEEVKRLRRGVSNLGFHYLGAAKIIAPIGKAFAEAMANLQTTQRQEQE